MLRELQKEAPTWSASSIQKLRKRIYLRNRGDSVWVFYKYVNVLMFFRKENAKLILEDMSLQVEEGGMLFLYRPQVGCGKNKRSSHHAGLLDPIDSIVFLDGEPITTKLHLMGYMVASKITYSRGKQLKKIFMLDFHIPKVWWTDERTYFNLVKQVGHTWG